MISIIRVAIIAVLIVVLHASCGKDDAPRPIIAAVENIFINELSASGSDWLELYNANQEPKDISGYFLYDDPANKYTIPKGTIIPSKGFLILFCDGTATGLHTNFKLSASGEVVNLLNIANELVDSIEFPALADGHSFGRYPDGSTTLLVSGKTSQGLSNNDSLAPAISNRSQDPLVPGLSTSVTIKVDVFSTVEISFVKQMYRFNSGVYSEAAMSKSGGSYTGTIPSQNATGKVDYYIEAKNVLGQASRDPVDAPTHLNHFLLNTDVLPVVYINEFMAANKSCCPDSDSGMKEFDDWIEIYNGGSVAVDVGGMYISDDKNKPFGYKIPKTNPTLTTIKAGGFLLLWADGSLSQGINHVDLKLSNVGEDVGLFYIDGRTIDVYTFGAQQDDVSNGRTTDGASTWKSFTIPTPGKSNN